MNTHRPNTRAFSLVIVAAFGLSLALIAGCQDTKSGSGSGSKPSGDSAPANGSGSNPSGQ